MPAKTCSLLRGMMLAGAALSASTCLAAVAAPPAGSPAARAEADPRVEAALTDPLLSEQHGTHDNGAWLIHQTRQSGLRVAAAMDHEIEGPAKLKVKSEATEDIGRTTAITRLQPGETLTIVKYLAYGWSARRSQPALHDQVSAALAAARFTGWDGLLAEQHGYLDAFWTTADIEIQADNLDFTKRTIERITAEHTGQSPETISRDGDRDRWFTAEEAREYGMVDQVVQSLADVRPAATRRRMGL